MKRIFLTIFIFIILSAGLVAQPRTSYFVPTSTVRHKLNPAFAPEHGYFAIPLLGNYNIVTSGNLGMSNLVYPLDNGNLGLFLNKEVPAEEFLGTLSPMNGVTGGMSMDLISFAFHGKHTGFWTVDFTLKQNMGVKVPYEFFQFMKQGMATSPQTYTINNMSMGLDMYGELSLGFSRNISAVEGLRVGGKVKLLMGMVDMNVMVDNMDINMTKDIWTIKSLASGSIHGAGYNFVHDENGNISGVETNLSQLGLAGMGGGFDLGVEYTLSEGTPVDGLRISASLVDMKWMTYRQDASVMLASEGEVVYKGGMFGEGDTGSEGDLNFASLFTLKDSPAASDVKCFMGGTFHAGLDYTFLKDKMNVGILYSKRFGRYENQELTFSYNYNPAKWFDVAVSYSVLNTHKTFGWLLTFTPKSFMNIFLGSDYTQIEYTPQGIPFNGAYFSFHMGLSVPFGRNVATH